ncbi:MAG: flagellar basal body P-ring formation chaperone FlgA [Alphaproteobacteria bacterium]|nr:flagellar basal body P-ring formation chaperone FlgA [Alphaproteobacteria bacterium]
MIRLLMALLIFAATSPALAQTIVRGDWVSLGDVAPVTGEAAAILVGPAPPPGEMLALDPAFLVAVAKRSGVILALPLDRPVWVKRDAAPSAAVPPAARIATPAPVARQAPSPPALASASAGSPAVILVLARDVGRGALLTASDLEWIETDTLKPGRGAPADLADALGMETKRPLKTGAPVRMSDLKAASVIRKGETVKLVYASGGLRLTVDGQAQSDAALGEPVRVLNHYSRRSIDAVASAAGEARVSR